MDINQDAYNEGKSIWGQAIGYCANPYCSWIEPEKFYSWHRGYKDADAEAEEIFQRVRQVELEKESEAERARLELKEKQKTKKGRAEIAGQTVLF